MKLNVKNLSSIFIGIGFGLLNNYSFFFVFIGELIFMIYTLIKTKGKIAIERKNLVYILSMIIFCVYIIICGIVQNNVNVYKQSLKYITITTEIVLFYILYEHDKSLYKISIPLYLIFSYCAEFIFNFNISDITKYKFPVVMFFSLYYAFNSKERSIKKELIYIFLFLIYSIYIGSRTTLFMSLVLCLFLFFDYLSIKKRKSNILTFYLIYIVVCLLFIVIYINISNSILLNSVSNNERLLLLRVSIEEFKLKPLFGVGVGNFNNFASSVLFYKFRANNLTPHNIIAEILCENGLIGGIIFFLPFFVLLATSIKGKNRNAILLLLMQYSYFLFNTFSDRNRIAWAILTASDIILVNQKK